MGATCKIIRLRPGHTSIHGLTENDQAEPAAPEDLQTVVAKARNVLDTMEKEWQMNHNSLVLVEQLHLLRSYLEFLRQYHEGNM